MYSTSTCVRNTLFPSRSLSLRRPPSPPGPLQGGEVVPTRPAFSCFHSETRLGIIRSSAATQHCRERRKPKVYTAFSTPYCEGLIRFTLQTVTLADLFLPLSLSPALPSFSSIHSPCTLCFALSRSLSSKPSLTHASAFPTGFNLIDLAI